MAVKLGDIVTDSITGFTGVAFGRCEYLHGCVKIGVMSRELKDGKPVGDEWFDEQRLAANHSAKSGGPQSLPR